MGEVFGYLASTEGTSVLVAVIALFGVLASTGWTNWEADKRRREDQTRIFAARGKEMTFSLVRNWFDNVKQLVSVSTE